MKLCTRFGQVINLTSRKVEVDYEVNNTVSSIRPEKAVEDEEEVEADDGDDLFKAHWGNSCLS